MVWALRRRLGGFHGWIIVAGTALAPTRGLAQEPGSTAVVPITREVTQPHLIATRTGEAPAIDGDLRDPSWAKGSLTTTFTQKFPNEAQAPSEPTELRVLYDDSSLYIAFNCVQIDVPVRGRLARRDRQVEADWVQVAIDDGTNTYEFTVNAAGVLGDGVRFNDTDYSADWDGVWEAQVVQHARGWSAEMRIPLRMFAHPDTGREWGFQARRYISERQETDEWVFIPRAVAGEVSHYGRLSGITGVRHSNPFELLPYVSVGATWTDMTPDGHALGGFDSRATVGLDLAWRVGNNLTLDASFNPDFAQVEADQAVLNLTTYETFVPDKRPFFLNGLAIFRMPRLELFPSPQTLFYTRRIGSVPSSPVVDETSAPEPSTIYAAAKLRGQLASGVTAGFLSAVTGRNDVTVQLPGAPAQQSLSDPTALANVARIKVDVAQGATLGVLATALQRFEPGNAYPVTTQSGGEKTQQCPDGTLTEVGARCFHDSYAVGIDGSWRSLSGTYVAAGQVLATLIQNGPPRKMLDGTIIGSGDISPAGLLYLAKEGGQWLGSVEVQAIGRRVDYNDLGYLQRQNLLRFLPYLAYRTLDPFWKVAEAEVHVYTATRDSFDGVKILRGYYDVGSKLRFKNFWIVTAELYRDGRRFEDREVGDGTALERPQANGLDLSLSTDPRRQFAASVSTVTLVSPRGTTFTLDGELTYQPLPRLELQLLPQITYTSGNPRFVPGDRAAGEPHLLFGDLRARSLGGTLRASYTFTNRLTLQVYGQLLLVAEHYSNFQTYNGLAAHPVIRLGDLTPADPPSMNPDSVETTLNVSAVLRWEFRPGSTLFLVYSRSQDPSFTPDGGARLDLGALRNSTASDALRLKVSYYWN